MTLALLQASLKWTNSANRGKRSLILTSGIYILTLRYKWVLTQFKRFTFEFLCWWMFCLYKQIFERAKWAEACIVPPKRGALKRTLGNTAHSSHKYLTVKRISNVIKYYYRDYVLSHIVLSNWMFDNALLFLECAIWCNK